MKNNDVRKIDDIMHLEKQKKNIILFPTKILSDNFKITVTVRSNYYLEIILVSNDDVHFFLLELEVGPKKLDTN